MTYELKVKAVRRRGGYVGQVVTDDGFILFELKRPLYFTQDWTYRTALAFAKARLAQFRETGR